MLVLLLQLMLTVLVYKNVLVPHTSLGLLVGFIVTMISLLYFPPICSLVIMSVYVGWMLQMIRVSDEVKWVGLIQVGIIFVVSLLTGLLIKRRLDFMIEYLIIALISIILIQICILFGFIKDIGWIKYIIIGLFTIWIVIDSNIMRRSPDTWNTAITLALNFYLDIWNIYSNLISN